MDLDLEKIMASKIIMPLPHNCRVEYWLQGELATKPLSAGQIHNVKIVDTKIKYKDGWQVLMFFLEKVDNG
jgi:hypothetical protein